MLPQTPLLLAGALLNAPPNATLRAVTWAGSGCGPSSQTTWSLLDTGVLDLVTPGFTASLGSGATERRKFCQVNLDIDVPSGWQHGLARLGVNGKVGLEEGVGGLVRGDVYFSGENGDKVWTKDFVGGARGGQQGGAMSFAEKFEVEEGEVWAPCGGGGALLNVKVEARFASREDTKTGSISVEHSGLEVKWRQCTK